MKLSKFKRVLLVLVLIFIIFLIFKSIEVLKRSEAVNIQKSMTIEGLKDEIKSESEKSDELNKASGNENTNEDYESLAREELGLIKKDEIVIKPR